jgi:hypothetical protein
MDEKIIKDLPRLKKALNINELSVPLRVLFDILGMDTTGMSNELFFEYLYVKHDYLNGKARLFLSALNTPTCLFNLIHGYSKNGKSTFLQYVRYINNIEDKKGNSRIIFIPFNFELGSNENYLEKVKLFWFSELCGVKPNKDIEEFIAFYHFYKEFVDDLKSEVFENDGAVAKNDNEILSYFDHFSSHVFFKMFSFLKTIPNIGDDLISYEKYKNQLKDELNTLISIENCGEIFSLLFLFRIFQQRYKLFYQKNHPQKLIFILDNIDDYLREKDILFLQYPQIQISTFVYNLTRKPIISSIFSDRLKKSIETETKNIGNWSFSFTSCINIVYTFRTSNFLAFSNIINEAKKRISQSQEKYFPECMLDVNFFTINTINLTDQILSYRLNFAKRLFNHINLPIPKGFYFLETLSTIAKSTSQDEGSVRNIDLFCLWNGDKKAFIESLIANQVSADKNYFQYEDIIKNCNEKQFTHSKYLLKGTYIYFFLFLFSNSSSLNHLLKTIYAYRRSQKLAKSLRRFLLNYIINVSENSIKPNVIKDIENRGTGLLDLLIEIKSFVTKVNLKAKTELYSFKDVDDFFKDTYTDKIDFFAQFFTIYKSQILRRNKDELNRIYYNLDKELRRFSLAKDYKKIDDLNQIRIFNNHNVSYLATTLISHFELFSFCLSHDESYKTISIQKPLIFCLGRKNNSEAINNIEDFEFYDIIKKVLENVKLIVDSMVSFYVKYLNDIPPHKFIEDKFLTLFNKEKNIGDFQFRLIIRRHITYLEGFRQSIITDSILNFDVEIKKMINKYLINVILEYIDLYLDKYHLIKDSFRNFSYQPDTILDKNYTILLSYQSKARKALIDNDEGIFNIVIAE